MTMHPDTSVNAPRSAGYWVLTEPELGRHYPQKCKVCGPFRSHAEAMDAAAEIAQERGEAFAILRTVTIIDRPLQFTQVDEVQP